MQLGATAGGSVSSESTSGIWIIGLRYKIIDANTTERVYQNYIESKAAWNKH